MFYYGRLSAQNSGEQHTEQRGNTMIGRPFKKGQSGNPGGRPKVVAEIRQLARERGPEAIAALVKVMTKGKSEAARDCRRNRPARPRLGQAKAIGRVRNNAPLRCRTPASLEQSGMAGEVRTDHRADRGIAYIWSRLGEVVRGNERALW
jgi:Family of unknown function (DUF5681)